MSQPGRPQSALNQLAPLERQLAERLDDAAVPMHWGAPDGTILWANQAELALLGYHRHEYVGRSIRDFHADRAVIDEILERLASGETLHELPARLRTKDGRIRHVVIDANVFFRAGRLVHTRCFTRDVTASRRVVEELSVTEARFQTLMKQAPVGIFVTDAEGDCRFVNERWVELAGLSPDEARGQGWAGALHPDDRERVFAEWYQAAREEREFASEYRFRRPDGAIVWLHGRALPLKNERGEVDEYLGSVTDITARKLADDARQRAREDAEQMAQRLELLAQASHAFTSAQLDARSLFEAVANKVLAGIADSCSILTVTEDGQHLVPVMLRARDPEAQRSALEVLDESPVPVGATTPGIVAQSGRPVLVPVVDQQAMLASTEAAYREHLRRFPIHSLLVVPVSTAGKMLGVLVMARTTPGRPFTIDDRALACDLADRAALALSQARAFEAERAARERLTRLYGLMGLLSGSTTPEEIARATVDDGCTTTRAATGLLYAREDDGWLRLAAQRGVPEQFLQGLTEIPPDSELPGGVVARTGEPIWIEGFEAYAARFPELAARAQAARRAPAFAAVPLLAEHQCLGVLAFGYGEPRRFSEEERAFICLIAHHCAQSFYRARLLQRAEQAALHAEEASRLKDEFLATVSHELRTPLSAILGWSAILATKRGSEPRIVAKAAEVIERNGQAQLRLIEDILDVSRIIRGQLRIAQESVDLESVAVEVIDSIKPSASAKAIDIAFACKRSCRVVGDADRLRQVLWNLLSNAVKFTPQDGSVNMEMDYDGSRVTIVVSDTGLGMDREFLPHAFDRFRQQDGGISRAYGGLGLGLAIVRHLVEMHGGTVDAESDGAGKGSRFMVTLPVRPFTSPSAPPADRSQSSPPAALSELSVLVVEDDPDARDLIAMVLSSEGATVEVAGTADEAVGLIGSRRLDVVVSDIAMPGQDGYVLVERLKRLQPGLPVIALTAFSSDSDAQRARRAGFDDYLIKPVDPGELVDVVARYQAGRTDRSLAGKGERV